jgi:two-component system, LytTR family, sensor kinase
MYIAENLNKPVSLFKFILANMALSFAILPAATSAAFQDWKTFLISYLWTFSIAISQWSGAVLINHLLDRKIKWADQPILRSTLGIIALVIYSVVAFMLVKYLMYFVTYGNFPLEGWKFAAQSSLFAVLISFNISIIFTAIGFFKAWKLSLIREEKLKTEMMAYKYESLRNQINPHFLFNSLNVLSDLVYDDQAMAVKFIQQMSDLFRYVLDSRDKELVSLKDELDFIRSFTFLLKTRFEDKLIIESDIQPNPDDYIVPMTLQLLIENAVKHNEVSEAFPLRISMRRNNDYLEVENDVRPKNVGEDSKKTGLKNIVQQFAFFSDQLVEIIPSGESFLVRVPILKSLEK